jgi:potassium-dependent mechanosensitive channel
MDWRRMRAKVLTMGWRGSRLLPPRSRALGLALGLVALAVCLPGTGVGAEATERTPLSSGPAASASAPPSAPAVIPVEEIAPRATEVASLLRSLAANLIAGGQIEAIRRSLPAFGATTTRELASTTMLLAERPSLETLQSLDQAWLRRQMQSTAWLDLLTEYATKLQSGLDRLQELHEIWTRTRDSEQAATAPASILQQVDGTLAAIEAAQPPNRTQRDEILVLQGQIAAEVVRCETIRTRIAQLQRGAVGGIFARDSRPIWSPDGWSSALTALPARVSQIAATYWAEVLAYGRDPSKRMPIHVGLFVLSLVALLAARGQVGEWQAAGRDVSRVAVVFDHPFAAALLLALMAATAYTSPAPIAVKQLLNALALVPMIILARPVVHPTVVPVLYALGVLFALDTVRHAVGGSPARVDQAIVFLESLGGIVVLAWLLLRAGAQGTSGEATGSGRRTLRRSLAGLILGGLAIGLIASAFGYLRVARLTTPAVLVGGAGALWFYAVVVVATAVTIYALSVWPLRRLRMVQHHRTLLETRIQRLLVWIAILAWLFRYLNYLGLWEPSAAFVGELLTTRIGFGSFSTSVGDVLAFVLTLVVAYLLSSFLRFVLQEDVYPRVGIPPGISYAASSLLHYVIIAVAFLTALGVLGVSMTQVTVLAGALGIGIGFGLQSVVNNFVSGLILLFEQPVHVGDAIQVGTLQGWVRRIGIRASILRTVQGAEVIIPNAQLITEQVTNWTLSDQQRRLDLPVGVSYGTAPGKVIELLEGVARAHPQVLKDPPPKCLFMGYGDSAINFELRAWTEYATTVQVHSDLTVAIYDAVYAAGMTFPFPQREVRLLSDPAVRQAVAGPDTGAKA